MFPYMEETFTNIYFNHFGTPDSENIFFMFIRFYLKNQRKTPESNKFSKLVETFFLKFVANFLCRTFFTINLRKEFFRWFSLALLQMVSEDNKTIPYSCVITKLSLTIVKVCKFCSFLQLQYQERLFFLILYFSFISFGREIELVSFISENIFKN